MPKVSIVLPTYNGEKYIREAIDSVINQTFTDWELIIVNDCSTDSTPQIIEEYAKSDDRIKVIHNEVNKKTPTSLNIGFREAKGEFLSWIADDNLFLPNAIEKMYNYLQNRDVYFVCSNMMLIDSLGDEIGPHMEYNEEQMYYENCVGACFMYKSNVLKEVGEYDTSTFLVEDYDYWLRILFKYKKIGVIKECLFLYRLHSESLTSIKSKESCIQVLKMKKRYLDYLLDYYQNNKMYLCAMYYDFVEHNFDIAKMKNKVFSVIPELKNEKEFDFSKPTIIYGAGKFGRKAHELLKENVAFFADSDKEKIGEYVNGIEIISVDDLVIKKNDYNILIARTGRGIYEVVEFLRKNGIYEFCVLQSVIAKQQKSLD